MNEKKTYSTEFVKQYIGERDMVVRLAMCGGSVGGARAVYGCALGDDMVFSYH